MGRGLADINLGRSITRLISKLVKYFVQRIFIKSCVTLIDRVMGKPEKRNITQTRH